VIFKMTFTGFEGEGGRGEGGMHLPGLLDVRGGLKADDVIRIYRMGT